MNVYHVCDTCAGYARGVRLPSETNGLLGPAITNNDYSAFDMQDTDTDRVTAFVELVGMLCDAGRVNKPGYWECESCAQVCIGSAYALESVA